MPCVHGHSGPIRDARRNLTVSVPLDGYLRTFSGNFQLRPVVSVVAPCPVAARPAMLFTSRNTFLPTSRLSSHGVHCGRIACQAQSMAAIPTFTGDSGPILSLTDEQRTEYAHRLGVMVQACGPQSHSLAWRTRTFPRRFVPPHTLYNSTFWLSLNH